MFFLSTHHDPRSTFYTSRFTHYVFLTIKEPCSPQISLQVFAFRIQTHEDTATNEPYPWHGRETSSFLKGTDSIVRSVQPDQVAFSIVYPAVKETDEAFGVASFLMTHHHFSVPANIEEHSYLFVLTTNNNHRLFTYDEGFEVPEIGNLTFIGDVVPGSLPVLIHFIMQGFKVSAILIGHLLIFADHEAKEKSDPRGKRSTYSSLRSCSTGFKSLPRVSI